MLKVLIKYFILLPTKITLRKHVNKRMQTNICAPVKAQNVNTHKRTISLNYDLVRVFAVTMAQHVLDLVNVCSYHGPICACSSECLKLPWPNLCLI